MSMMNHNPFSDPAAAAPSIPTTPRIRVTEINDTNVVLAVEMVDSQGYPVFTLNRACLRVGDTLSISDITIKLEVTHARKESQGFA